MKKRVQRLVPAPIPLLTCPGLSSWRPYFGSPYRVFVDESFRGFFEFDARGYFVHATVGVPESRYASLGEMMMPVFNEYRELTSEGQREFKHSEFKRIAFSRRRGLARQMRRALKEHGVFINVFYTPLRSFVLEHLRTELYFAGKSEIPSDHRVLYETAVNELRSEATGPGQSGLIKKLLLLPVSGVANLLATFESKFTVVYDPREKKEDKAVVAAIDTALAALLNLKGKDVNLRWDLHSYLTGFEHHQRSENEIGLQLADLLAGETRAFFEANPEQLEYAASRTLITQRSYEPIAAVARMGEYLFKQGALTRLPAALRRRWWACDRKGSSVLPLFSELFGAGVATCYSSWGQPRHIAIFDGYVLDQVE